MLSSSYHKAATNGNPNPFMMMLGANAEEDHSTVSPSPSSFSSMTSPTSPTTSNRQKSNTESISRSTSPTTSSTPTTSTTSTTSSPSTSKTMKAENNDIHEETTNSNIDSDKHTMDPSLASTHYIFLVHGWLGDSSEMSYIEEALKKAQATHAKQQPSSSSSSSSSSSDDIKNNSRIVIHSVTSNNGKTADGIANGGIRIAQEIQNFIKRDYQIYTNIKNDISLNQRQRSRTSSTTSIESSSSTLSYATTTTNESTSSSTSMRDEGHISLSFIGNSLGGLYARYALSCIPHQLEIANISIKVHLNIFCTTVTPHLGVSSNTYVKIPRFMEYIVGNVLLKTGRDLFRIDSGGGYDGYDNNNNDDDRRRNKNEDKDMTASNSNDNLILYDGRGTGTGTGTDTGNDADCTGSSSIGDEYVQEACLDNHENNINHNKNMDDENQKLFHTSATTSSTSTHQANDLIYKMAVDESFLKPLMSFRKRIAYINAFGSDFQVPTSTAAFLDRQSSYPHYIIERQDSSNDNDNSNNNNKNDFITSIVKTRQDKDIIFCNSEWYKNKSPHLFMSNKLDALGWYKVFIDTRDRIPIPSFQFWSIFDDKTYREKWDEFVSLRKKQQSNRREGNVNKKNLLEDDDMIDKEQKEGKMKIVAEAKSKDLYRLLTSNDRVQVPAGHAVLVANSKNKGYEEFSAKGRPVMDSLGRDFIRDIF